MSNLKILDKKISEVEENWKLLIKESQILLELSNTLSKSNIPLIEYSVLRLLQTDQLVTLMQKEFNKIDPSIISSLKVVDDSLKSMTGIEEELKGIMEKLGNKTDPFKNVKKEALKEKLSEKLLGKDKSGIKVDSFLDDINKIISETDNLKKEIVAFGATDKEKINPSVLKKELLKSLNSDLRLLQTNTNDFRNKEALKLNSFHAKIVSLTKEKIEIEFNQERDKIVGGSTSGPIKPKVDPYIKKYLDKLDKVEKELSILKVDKEVKSVQFNEQSEWYNEKERIDNDLNSLKSQSEKIINSLTELHGSLVARTTNKEIKKANDKLDKLNTNAVTVKNSVKTLLEDAVKLLQTNEVSESDISDITSSMIKLSQNHLSTNEKLEIDKKLIGKSLDSIGKYAELSKDIVKPMSDEFVNSKFKKIPNGIEDNDPRNPTINQAHLDKTEKELEILSSDIDSKVDEYNTALHELNLAKQYQT